MVELKLVWWPQFPTEEFEYHYLPLTATVGTPRFEAAKPGSAGPKSGTAQGFRSYQWCGRLVLVYIIVRCTRYIRYLQPLGSYV